MKHGLILAAVCGCLPLPALADELGTYLGESRAAGLPFLRDLNAANQQAMAAGGPEAAINVCKELAPQMAGALSRRNGWKLTRVSLKARNPLLGTPDQWEQTVLQQYEERLAKGETPEALETAEIVNEANGKSFRYMKAIVLQQGCLACHGKPEQLSGGLKARLGQEYPYDKAIGYAPGQLRGALSIKRRID